MLENLALKYWSWDEIGFPSIKNKIWLKIWPRRPLDWGEIIFSPIKNHYFFWGLFSKEIWSRITSYCSKDMNISWDSLSLSLQSKFESCKKSNLGSPQTWISGAWKNSGHITWTSTQDWLQGGGILQAQFAALYVWYTHCCSICGSWFLCHFWGMGWVGTVISLLREMFLQHLGTHFGLCFVISRCLDSCLLARWIERWRGLAKGLFCKHIDHHLFCF